MITLYTTALSANGRKVLAVARHLELPIEVHPVDVYRGEGATEAYRAIHPQGRVPALVEDDFVLFESNAILQYLSEGHGGFRLSSRDPKDRAQVARWLFWEAAHWQPAWIPVLRDFVAHALLPDRVPAPAAPPDWGDAEVVANLAWLESQLAAQPFVAGAAPTLADFSVAGMTTYLRAAGFPFGAHPAFAAWMVRMDALPAWRSTARAPWAA